MSESKSEKDPYLFQITTDLGEVSFDDFEEFTEWLDVERTAFDWVKTTYQGDGNLGGLNQSFNQFHTSLTSLINQYKKAAEQGRDSIVNQIMTACNLAFSNKQILSSASSNGRFILSLKGSESSSVAAYALGVLLNIKNLTFTSQQSVRGAYLAYEYLKGNSDTHAAQVESLEGLKKSWSIKLGKFLSRIKSDHAVKITEQENLQGEFVKLEDGVKKLNSVSTTQQGERENSFELLMETFKADMVALKQYYSNELSMLQPVQYWKNRRKKHSIFVYVSGIVSIVLASMFFFGFITIVDTSAIDTSILSSIKEKYESTQLANESISEKVVAVPKTNELVTKSDGIFRITILLLYTTIGFWFLRISTKIFLSNLHLRADADERVTMMEVYLSMMKENHLPDSKDRALILNSLFRSSATGYIKEDGPVGVADIISRTLSRS